MNTNKVAKLSGIFLENFQSLKDPVFFQINKLCFFYGPNSSGKSAIHDALYLIKETITNERDWNFYNLYNRYGAGFGTKLGLEIVSGTFGSDPEESLWKNTPSRTDDFDHFEFFEKIKHKKIQIEISELGNQMKVAIEGRPLFELLNESTFFTTACEKITSDELNDKGIEYYEQNAYEIRGKLVIYKNVLADYFSICSFSDNNYLDISDGNKPFFTNLFYEDHLEKQVFNGITLSLGSKELTDIDYICNRIISEKLFESDDESESEIYENSVNEFHRKSGNIKKSLNNFRSDNNRIIYQLENLQTDYAKIIKGLIFQIKNALIYSHVKGDRQLLNSKHCISYETNQIDTYLNLSEENRDDLDPIKIYARSLLNKNYLYYEIDKPKFEGDFINHCLNKYLPCLNGYKVFPKIFNLYEDGEKKNPNNTLIYLFIKNKLHHELGFQDVGSGISYILPILASIWCRNISFVEQPELHLHPKAQCELGDAFICSTYYGNSSIIESHSEHLLLRISRRIRETTNNYLLPDELKLDSKDVTIYYFDPQPNGTTKVKNIRMDRYGELMDVWPGGFFSERDDELFS